MSTTVHPGDVVSIIGPSGCGKCTFLRCLNWLESFQQGELQVLGRSIAGTSLNWRELRQLRISWAWCFSSSTSSPTSALDPELVGEVLQAMRLLAETGMTMLVVTHEMRFAREVSNHVLFFNNGLIEEQGSPDALFGNPRSERLRGFLSRSAGASL